MRRWSLPLTPLLSAPDATSPLCDLLPLNAQVTRGKPDGNFIEVPGGFVHARRLAPRSRSAADFVAVAEQFLGVPYVWGGKTFQGLDCSGLIQTALQAAGMSAPRDTDMMERELGQIVAARESPGAAIWSSGKAMSGVMRDSETLLHANAFHMQVTSEPLAVAIDAHRQAGDGDQTALIALLHIDHVFERLAGFAARDAIGDIGQRRMRDR